MKIVCESCGAKYSIADDRVSGKAFKIRCKRCSEVIIVRGDQQAQPAAAAAQPQPEAQDGIWHVVIDGDQSGPYTPAQVGDMLNAGTLDWEAYVWTEGFDNWLPMRDVPDLVALITGEGAQEAQPAQSAPKTATLVGQPSMGADPFADDSAPSSRGMFESAPASSAGPDLFGSAAGDTAPSPFPSPKERTGMVASSATPRSAAADVSLTGARNENSVLFSLKNLQALATGSSSPSVPTSSSDRAAGFATGEGSGLIDIRALASATGIGEASPSTSSKDALLSLGSQGGAFGTLGSPMLAPVGDTNEGGNKAVIWAIVAAVALLSLAAVAVAYIMRAPAPQVSPTVAMVPPPAAPAPAAPSAGLAIAPVQQQPAHAPTEGELAAKAAAESPKPASETSHGGGATHGHRPSEPNSSKPAGSPSVAAAQSEQHKAPAKPGGSRSIDSLLDGALNGPSTKPGSKAVAVPASDLPDTPAKADVLSSMNAIKGDVVHCGGGQGGVATVTISVAGTTGKVTTAQVAGVTGPSGSCIAQAVRKAQFPKFQQKVFKLVFPFKL